MADSPEPQKESALEPGEPGKKRRIRVAKNMPKVQRKLSSDLPTAVNHDANAPDMGELECPAGRDVECTGCGTLIGFITDRCPICGTPLDSPDLGIVGLFDDMQFDGDLPAEMDCPSCGERIKLIRGRCPACNELVHADDSGDPDRNVEPLIQDDNVVYLHLDVESGELDCLQRLARRLGFERLTLRLNGRSHGGNDVDDGTGNASST